MILGGSALVVVFAAAVGFGFTQRDEEPTRNTVELASAVDKAGQQACASTAAYDQLKSALFTDALKVRSSDPENLNTLATHSVVRMEDPVVKSRDAARGTVDCSGTFILELPPGAEAAFGGQRRLTADIDYTARPAADGSGYLYQINGAERIMAQLADFNLQNRAFVPTGQPDVEFAEALPPLPPAMVGMGGPHEPLSEEVAEEIAEAREEARERAEDARKKARERAEEAREQRQERAERARERREDRQARAERSRRAEARPSFNCRYARTRSERMVCDDRGLAARDREMSAMFYGAMGDADRRTRRELNRTRDRFLAYRDRCRSEQCVAQAYEGRMREISDIMAASE